MKLWELATGILTHLTEEEDELLNKFIKNEKYRLSEREEVIAHRLVQKDVLTRIDGEEQDTYKINYRTDVWRD